MPTAGRVPASVAKEYVRDHCGLHPHEVPAALTWLFGPAAYHPGEPKRLVVPSEPPTSCVKDAEYYDFMSAVMADWSARNISAWLKGKVFPLMTAAGFEMEFRRDCPGRFALQSHFNQITPI